MCDTCLLNEGKYVRHRVSNIYMRAVDKKWRWFIVEIIK